jgi:hypothetical protein
MPKTLEDVGEFHLELHLASVMILHLSDHVPGMNYW